MDVIDSFSDEFHFLSNFYYVQVYWEGIKYPSSEAAYQASKSLDPVVRKRFKHYGPGLAKKQGRAIQVRDDWDSVKVDIMKGICRAKFDGDADLRERLLLTGDIELIEGNYWGDTFWGVCGGVGENMLGKILMEIREGYK